MPTGSHIEAITRMLRVLEAFEGRSQVSLNDLASSVPIVKSSIYRILFTLEQSGCVSKSENGTYCTTPRFGRLAGDTQSGPGSELPAIALPFMAALLRRFQETVNLRPHAPGGDKQNLKGENVAAPDDTNDLRPLYFYRRSGQGAQVRLFGRQRRRFRWCEMLRCCNFERRRKVDSSDEYFRSRFAYGSNFRAFGWRKLNGHMPGHLNSIGLCNFH